jgi:hypothetical protein
MVYSSSARHQSGTRQKTTAIVAIHAENSSIEPTGWARQVATAMALIVEVNAITAQTMADQRYTPGTVTRLGLPDQITVSPKNESRPMGL